MASLHGRDLDSWTRPWEHDNAFIRLPALFFRHDVPRFWRFIRPLWQFNLLGIQIFWRLLLFLCLVGILYYVGRGQFPLGLLVLFSGMVRVSRMTDVLRRENERVVRLRQRTL